ncbi:Conjugative transfer protein TrbD [Comamonas testosteroni]|nr:TrbD [Delftia acidovorans]AEX00463.1 TrbD [Delftia acidovorans]AEX00547.1 TrbD [Comamonas testosteroni]KWT70566.1 Conjugative transfer protein TrbD [Comamonas testosteroni]
MGGDRELVMFSGLLAGALIFSAQEVRATVFGIALWFGALFVLRLMAKSDPKLRHVYLRHRRYKPYYPARSTPFRENTPSQGKQYK